ncbi:aminoglycoside phosphotransferase family protein [Kitasatospora sp. NPDC048540]|uniref:aminoglycoside phosphotransferase family protein n=1 Tax=Kitasatospora sp. NPDC048540 TaxID=3155634 RepID=UPI0033CE78F2
MAETAGRTVKVLVTWRGERLGTVGPFPVESPWWAEVGPVAERLESVLGVPALVLRLHSVVGGEDARGGLVTYHAEALRRPGEVLGADDGERLDGDPLRAEWATPDGLRSALDWAGRELTRLGRPVAGPVRQVKSWNLSGLIRLPTAAGPVWLKTTPRFAVAEAEVIAAFAVVDPGLVPAVLAADGRRMLLDHVPGEDCWGVPDDAMLAVVGRWAAAQARLAGGPAVPGLPDRSPGVLAGRFRALLASGAVNELGAGELAAAYRLADALPALTARLAACGLPVTVVHGDFHPGNWRFDGRRTVAVDFSDAHLGHPAVDGLRPRAFLPPARWAEVRRAWVRAWSELLPGSDPAGALVVAEPLMHLSYAVRYQEFLDGIEPSERIYHAGDPASEVRAALASVGGGSVNGTRTTSTGAGGRAGAGAGFGGEPLEA